MVFKFKSAKPHRVVEQIGKVALIEYFDKKFNEKEAKYQLMLIGDNAHKRIGYFTKCGVFNSCSDTSLINRVVLDWFGKTIQREIWLKGGE